MKNNKTNRREFIAKTTIAATGLSLGLNTITATIHEGRRNWIRQGAGMRDEE